MTTRLDVGIDISRMALDPGLKLRLACTTDSCFVCFASGAAKYVCEHAHSLHDLFIAVAEGGLGWRITSVGIVACVVAHVVYGVVYWSPWVCPADIQERRAC